MHGCDLDDLNSSFASPKLDIAMTMSLWLISKIMIHDLHMPCPMEFADFAGILGGCESTGKWSIKAVLLMLESLSPYLHYTILLVLKGHVYNRMSIPLFLKRKSQHCWLNERLSFQNTL
jgi:hypothetical protein